MRDIALCLFDLDGTLLMDDHRAVSPRTEAALHAAHRAGVALCVATGRSRAMLPPLSHLPIDYFMTANGADLRSSGGTRIHSDLIPAQSAAAAWEILRPRALFVEWFTDNQVALDAETRARLGSLKMPEWHRLYFDRQQFPVFANVEAYLAAGAPMLEKINLLGLDPNLRPTLWETFSQTGLFELSSSLGRNMEINGRGCTKGRALSALCAHLGISTAHAAAFGDGGNDVDMLAVAGYGVAMGNAVDAARLAAAHGTASNAEDGVAVFLEDMLRAKRGA